MSAKTLLTRAPLFDAHNDCPGSSVRPAARGDVVAYDLARPHRRATPTFRVCARASRRAVLGGVPTDRRAASRAHRARADRHHPAHRGGASRCVPSRAQGRRLRARARQGKIASYIVVEGGVGLENSLAPLRVWYAAGARMLIPCHNETLDWVDSATDAPRNGGFNAFGRAVIGECNRLGVIVDGAHVSARGLAQACSTSARRRSCSPTPTPFPCATIRATRPTTCCAA